MGACLFASIDFHLGLCFCCVVFFFWRCPSVLTDQWVFRDNLFSIHCAFDRVCWARNEDQAGKLVFLLALIVALIMRQMFVRERFLICFRR